MSTVLEANQLVKRYGSTTAVNNLNITFDENVIYGLLGRNGAGKTTLLNMLTGNIFLDRGEVNIFGQTVKSGESAKGLCFIREKGSYFNGFRIKEIFEIAASFHPNWDSDYAFDLLGYFKLDPNKKYRQLSRGMESLVGIIIGLAAREPLTIFDEPVLGLDVLVREKFYKVLMEDYANNPRTFVLSTHLIDEIANIVEKVYIIDSGELLLSDDMENIQNKSYFISGKKAAVDTFVANKNVLHREFIGNSSIASIFDTLDEEDRQEAKRLELVIEGMPFQKFFAYFVEGSEQA